MKFKSDKQRKAVMAKLNQGSVKSDVKPKIINNPSNKKAVKDDIRDSKYYKKMDSYNATGLAEGFVEPSSKKAEEIEKEIISAWQWLVDTGQVWHLQGWFGRNANSMLESGILKPPKKTRIDAYGNPVNPKRFIKK
tara:strand:+ start:2596 stop:3003 length:408 start_codon:yes stop_codon:yes gene_type:complete